MCQNSWLEQQKATYRFLRLREADPNKAKQWISKTLSARSDVMLISPETGLPMHTSEMASVVMRDLQDKVGSCKAGVASDSSRALAAISKIRASGGFPKGLVPIKGFCQVPFSYQMKLSMKFWTP